MCSRCKYFSRIAVIYHIQEWNKFVVNGVGVGYVAIFQNMLLS